MKNRDEKGRFIKGHKVNLGMIVGEEKRRKLREYRLKNSHLFKHYKGGVNKLIRRSYDTNLYKNWRQSVYKRDGFKCVECEYSGKRLEAHHIIMFSKLFEIHKITDLIQAADCKELWSVDNGKTLCHKCHQETKPGRPKKGG